MLPIFISSNRDMIMMQNQWSAQINPLLANPLAAGQLLQNVVLTVGSNSVDHKLGRRLIGWYITRKRNAAVVYDNQDNNPIPALTLLLNADISGVCDIYVF